MNDKHRIFSLTGERKSKLVAPCAGQRELCLSYLLRGLLHMLMHPAALEGGDAGAALLQDLIIRHELQEASIFSGRPVSSKTMLSGDRSMIFAL